ncbi:hypothetical protein K488DRAFT_67848 [Vararia minispora EC-137]|uniref:Uncharacterized protein n=1 Tax=Vararia minispora EC-137 TaxID=1314806 RepID=A0ACB8QX54_9AGAM|nr:hypothetical protein K488DRAFT_67848 [Vararia minispora EC-137]
MASIEPIVFYDVPRVPREGADPNNKAFSSNTWKTRYVLNMKGIPYKTRWIEYPDIADEMKRIGGEPGAVYGGIPFYTVPTIYDPNTKTVVTNSDKIAAYLDKQYPQAPVLFPPHTRALQAAVTKRFDTILQPMLPMFLQELYDIMTDYSKPYIRATREQFLGCKIEEAAPTGERKEQMIQAIEGLLTEMYDAIKESGEDAMLLGGDIPIYADVLVAAVLAPTEENFGKDNEVTRIIYAANNGFWPKYLRYFDKYKAVH